MKYLIITLFLFLLSFVSKSQQYDFPHDSATWEISWQDGNSFPPAFIFDDFFFKRNIVINDKSYNSEQ